MATSDAPNEGNDSVDSEPGATRAQRIAWLYTVSRRSLHLARRYTREGEGGRARASACVRAVNEYRHEIRDLRCANDAAGPGLAYTDAETPSARPATLRKGA